MQSPSNVVLDGSITSPITWDTGKGTGAAYDITNFTLQNSYAQKETIGQNVAISTFSVTSPKYSLLDLHFSGPSNSTTNGSYFYVGAGASSIADLSLTGDGTTELDFQGVVLFNGTLQTEVGPSAQCDSINVIGSLTFGTTAYILPIYNGGGNIWQVFLCSGTWSDWSNVSVPSGWSLGDPGFIQD